MFDGEANGRGKIEHMNIWIPSNVDMHFKTDPHSRSVATVSVCIAMHLARAFFAIYSIG